MEEARSRKLGGSLKVPNVQELAKQQLAAVPPRYIGDDIEKPVLTSILPQVPVIDMKRLLAIRDNDSELERLHLACKEWGFFQLVNHGVSSSLVEKVKSEIRAFFDLPMEEKNKFEQQEGDVEGDALEQYSAQLKELAMKIIYKMAKALGMQAEDMKVLFEEGVQMMRINYYPPCPQPELVMGLCPHPDSVGLTILLQVNETEGLQIKKKNGAWVLVPYLPDAFVVNIGDSLEIVTNGIYRSTEHRAIVNKDKERISIATFFGPNWMEILVQRLASSLLKALHSLGGLELLITLRGFYLESSLENHT